jgi:23S rRNA (guanosine2251-2'-O)-methyltransferase
MTMSQRDDLPPDDRTPNDGKSRFERPTPRPPQRPASQPPRGTNQLHPNTVRRRPEDQPPREDRPYSDRPQGNQPPPLDRPRQDGPRQDRPSNDRAFGDRSRGNGPPSRDRPRPDRQTLTSRQPDRQAREDRPRREDRPGPPPDVVSGLHAVEALLRWQPQRVQALYVWASDARVRARVQELAQKASIRVEAEAPRGFEHETANPQGVAVRVTPFEYADLERIMPLEGPADGTLIICLDSITDPRNLGAILRSAAFFRATAVIIPQDRSADVTALVERVAEGGAASVPVVQVVNLARTLASLRERGVEVVGTALDGATGDLRTYKWAKATCLVLGAEGSGIRPLVRKNCDQLLTLPGPEQMPSLNVSAFATLTMAMVRGSQPAPQ